MTSKIVLLLVIGTFCMSFILLTRPISDIPAGPGDFIKGLGLEGPGLVYILSAFTIQHNLERKYQGQH